jgi:DNA-binding CsgD family transcriptional regulator
VNLSNAELLDVKRASSLVNTLSQKQLQSAFLQAQVNAFLANGGQAVTPANHSGVAIPFNPTALSSTGIAAHNESQRQGVIDKRNAIADFIKNSNGLVSSDVIAEALLINKNTIKKHLRDMCQIGRIFCSEPDGRVRFYGVKQ